MSWSVSPHTPSWTAPLSRELEAAIAKRNLLTARSRSRLLDDLSAAAREGEDAHQETLRERAVRELLESERSYLRHLQIVEEFFMRPLQERDWLPRSDFVSIFGDLPSIVQVNAELLSCLEASEDRIGKVFLDLAPYLKFYSTYAQEFQTSAALVERWSEKNSRFKEFLESQETRPEVQLKLNALLITPVQRIPRQEKHRSRSKLVQQ